MSDSTIDTSRRSLLKMMGGLPVLPLAGGSLATFLTACGSDSHGNSTVSTTGSSSPTTSEFVSAEFVGMEAPTLSNPANMAKTAVSSKLVLNYADGSKRNVQLTYKPFFTTGDVVAQTGGGSIVAGGYVDAAGNPVTMGGASQLFSDCVDGTSLFTVPGAPLNTVFAVVQFEYHSKYYGELNSPIAILKLEQDPETGALTFISYFNVDTSTIHGLWIPCGGSLSPWSTHLSSEEYMPDAFDQGDNQSLATLTKFSTNTFGHTTANPYHYGHLPEVKVNTDGTGSIKKYYNQGRYSRELVQVFPDNRTLIGGDDANNGGLFMFVADVAGDLSSGTLYVAKYTSTLNETTAGDIKWIKLGKATSAEIETLANAAGIATLTTSNIVGGKEVGIKTNSILASSLSNPGSFAAVPADAADYKQIKLNGKDAWVKILAGQEKAAAFLETHRYAALKGGSLVFTKMEGTSLNIKDKKAYSALAAISGSAVAGNALNKEIGLDASGVATGVLENSKVGFVARGAGLVLEHDLAGGQLDSEGHAINSDWVPVKSRVLLAGEDIAAAADPLGLGNTAHPDKISCPDNLKYSEKLRTLFIGEDSGQHVNNYLWAYNVDTKKMSRLLSGPAGAENTGLHGVDDLNGFTYIMSSFQHAGEFTSGTTQAVRDAVGPLIDVNYKGRRAGEGNNSPRQAAAVGYITGSITNVNPAIPNMAVGVKIES